MRTSLLWFQNSNDTTKAQEPRASTSTSMWAPRLPPALAPSAAAPAATANAWVAHLLELADAVAVAPAGDPYHGPFPDRS
ncbi:Transcriptional regulator of ribosomal biogenesis proteins [Fusarium falciforme]|nr:Transcriptional regulator of ribosomal biogenesis proteins [Fusarium falciforme]